MKTHLKPPRASRLPFEVWALVAGGFAVALGYGVVAPAIPQFALQFQVSTFWAAAIVSAFALLRLVSAPLAGWLLNRLGERIVYTTGLLLVAASTGAAALAVDYTQFVVLRGLGGTGSAMFSVAATALIARLSPPTARAKVAGLNSAAFLLGGLLGPVLGGIVAQYGIRAPFVFYFCTLLVAASVVAVALGRVQKHSHPHPATSLPSATLSYRAALRIAHFPALLWSNFVFGWAVFGVRVSLIPLLVAISFQGDATIAAWILAAYAAGNLLFVLPGSRWSDRSGRMAPLISGAAILAGSYAAIGFASTLWLLAAAMFFAGAGAALVNPSQQALFADLLGRKRAAGAVASYTMASDLGAVLGPLVAGLLIDELGFAAAAWVSGGLLLSVAITWIVRAIAAPTIA